MYMYIDTYLVSTQRETLKSREEYAKCDLYKC